MNISLNEMIIKSDPIHFKALTGFLLEDNDENFREITL
jgi:hypothetical protein